jgi:hypothetical protein
MITMETGRLVDDYLRRLDEAAAHLQRSRRTELVAEIREHIETALRQEDEAGEAAVRNVLERLGPPEEIVDAAEPPAEADLARPGRLELGALIALIVPVLGWLVGLVLVFVSRAWSGRDKLVALTLLVAPLLLPFFGLVMESGSEDMVPVDQVEESPSGLEEQGSTPLGPLEILTLALFFLAGLPPALYLGWQLRSRRG